MGSSDPRNGDSYWHFDRIVLQVRYRGGGVRLVAEDDRIGYSAEYPLLREVQYLGRATAG